MVVIRVEEFSKYAFLICAMCGEILKSDLKKVLGSERMARRAVQKAREDKLLAERSTPLGRFTRLTKNGYHELAKIPPLRAHYDILTKKHTFSNDRATLQRRKAMSRTILTFLENETPQNGILLRFDNRPGRKKAPAGVSDTVLNPVIGKELFTGLEHVFVTYEKEDDLKAGEIHSFREHARRVASGSVNFFPSNVVKRHRDSERSTTGNMNSTRTKGQLFGDEMSYAVYYMEKGPIETPVQNELRYAEYMTDIYESIYGKAAARKQAAEGRKGSAVIIGAGDMLSSFILSENEKFMRNSVSSKIVLPTVYSQVHFAAFGDRFPNQILKNDWEENLIKELYLPAERQKAKLEAGLSYIKAVVRAGGTQMLSMPLFSLDIVKINDSISEVLDAGEPLHILCPKEYEEQIRKIYERYDKANIETINITGA